MRVAPSQGAAELGLLGQVQGPLTGRLPPRQPTMKCEQYRALVDARKSCRLCKELKNPSEVAGGSFDSDQLGPYTRWHGDLSARLLVVGMDFAPVARFVSLGGRPGSNVETNRRLADYLRIAGFDPGLVSSSHAGRGLSLTNAVLCLPGGDRMRTTVRSTEVRTCADLFLRETLRLVEPQAVATRVAQATNAVLHACDMPAARSFHKLVREKHGLALPCGAILFAMPHPVAPRPREEHEAAWRRVATWFERSQAAAVG